MHVTIANLTNGGLSGGYEKYLRELLPRLAADPRVQQLEILLPPQAKVLASQLRLCGTYHFWPFYDHALRFGWVRRRVREMAPDVVFIPTARWLDFGAVPTLVMVRNMEPFIAPFAGNPPLERLRNLLRARAARNACQQATKIIGVSQFVSQFLSRTLQIPKERTATVYHGLATKPPAARRPSVLGAGHLMDDFLFAAGALRPNRGLEDAIMGLAELRGRRWRPRLLIAGVSPPATKGYARWLRRLAEQLGVDGQLLWLGYLDQQELAWCFQHCSIFVMTSRVEACPNTVLEAIQHGCLSLSSDCMPMPEFFGDSAHYYRGGDPKDFADRLYELRLLDDDDKGRLRSAALARARDFDWDNTAKATVTCMLEAAGAVPPRRSTAA